jgi:uncharacterized protein YcbK (DUF882 family)
MLYSNIPHLSKKLVVLALVATLSSCASSSGLSPFARNGTVTYSDSSWCLPGRLKRVMRQVAYKYGNVSVHSTHRSWWHNLKVGGAKRSLHRRCRAADFSVDGNMKAAYKYISRHNSVGGHKWYPSGHIHIDAGAKRSW